MSKDNNGNNHDPLTGRFVSKPFSDDDLNTDFFSLEREQCLKLAKRREIDLLWRASNIEVAVTFPETEQIFEGTAPYEVERRKVQVLTSSPSLQKGIPVVRQTLCPAHFETG